MKFGIAVVVLGLASFVVGLLSVQGALKIQPETLSSHGSGTCAVAEDATVVCWPNIRGGDHGGVYRVDGLHDAVAVQPWGSAACAVHRDRTVSCGPLWFALDFADGLPLQIAGLVDVENLAASDGGLCAQFGDGTVGCARGTSPPAVVAPLPGVDDAIDVAVSSRAVCVLRSNGEVGCRALAGDAELRPVVSGATSLLAADVGFGNTEFMCATFAEGFPECWSAMTPQPAMPFRVTGVQDVEALANPYGSVCSNAAAQQCFRFSDRSVATIRYAAPVDAVLIASSDLHNCASRPDGTVQCAGRLGGRLGDVDEAVTIPARDFSGPVRQGWAIGTGALVLLGVSMIASTFSPHFRPVYEE